MSAKRNQRKQSRRSLALKTGDVERFRRVLFALKAAEIQLLSGRLDPDMRLVAAGAAMLCESGKHSDWNREFSR